jgi:hypothetical protein
LGAAIVHCQNAERVAIFRIDFKNQWTGDSRIAATLDLLPNSLKTPFLRGGKGEQSFFLQEVYLGLIFKINGLAILESPLH